MIRALLSRGFRTAGVAWVPAAVLLCCAGDAAAGCGDYVQIVGVNGTVQAPTNHDQAPIERPCQGPSCTGGPKAPAPVPAAPSSVAPDVKGLVGDADDGSSSDIGRQFDLDPADLPLRGPQAIFHPPRAG